MRSLTASDRKNLICLASSLPAGSSERKAILAGLKSAASEGVNIRGKHLLENAEVGVNAKVYGDAMVSGNARVFGAAIVYENAKVFGNAEVSGNAFVRGKATVSDRAVVSGDAAVFMNAKVYGDAMVFGDAKVFGKAKVGGNAVVYGTARIGGTAIILGGDWDGSEGEINFGTWDSPPAKPPSLKTFSEASSEKRLSALAAALKKANVDHRVSGKYIIIPRWYGIGGRIPEDKYHIADSGSVYGGQAPILEVFSVPVTNKTTLTQWAKGIVGKIQDYLWEGRIRNRPSW